MNTYKLDKKTKVILNSTAIFIAIVFMMWAQSSMSSYGLRILNLIAINAILAVSLNLINGITGIFSLGHIGFMAVGAYTASLLTLSVQQKQQVFFLEPLIWPLNSIQLDFFTATIIGGLVAAFFGLLIAVPALRLRDDYLAIATLGFSEIIRIFANYSVSLTNGALGLKGLPNYTNIWWSFGFLALTTWFIVKLTNSTYGKQLKAIRDDEIAARAMGINVKKLRVISFVVGSFFAGIAGSLMAHLLTTIDPKMFMFVQPTSVNILVMIVLGGLGSTSGAIIGAIIITFLSEWLRFIEGDMNLFGHVFHGIPGMRMLIFSALMVILMIFYRKGIMGEKEVTWDYLYNLIMKFKKKTPTEAKVGEE